MILKNQMDQELLERAPKHMLSLPIELRDQIFSYLLPADEVISYQRSAKYKGPSNWSPYGHRRYGPDSARSHLQERERRRLDIMRTCSILYEDCSRLLYNRTFQLEIGDSGPFFINLNSVNAGSFDRFPFDRMKCISINVETSFYSEALRSTINTLKWVCRTLSRADRIRKLQVVLCFTGALTLLDLRPGDVDSLLEPFRLLFNTRHVAMHLRVSTYSVCEELQNNPSLAIPLSGASLSIETMEDEGGMMWLVDRLVEDFSILLLSEKQKNKMEQKCDEIREHVSR